MKKLYYLLLGCSMLFSALPANAGAGIFQDYIIFNENGSTIYRHGGENADMASFTFDAHNFATPSTLILNGGEIKSYKNNCTDVTGAKMYYRVYVTGTSAPAFTEVNLPYDSELVNPGDQKWDETALGVDLLAGRCAADYTLEVYWLITTNACDAAADIYESNGGLNYKAYFTVGGDYEWTGANNSNWHDAGNWCGNTVPGNTDDVYIPNVANDPVISSSFGDVRNLTIASGASLTINSGQTLFVKEDVSNSGSADLGSGTLVFDGSVNQHIAGSIRVDNMDVEYEVYLEAGSSVQIDRRLALENFGNLYTGAGTLTMNSEATPSGTAYISHVSGNIIGNATIEMYVHNGSSLDQHLIASPVNSPSVSVIGDDLSGPWGSGLPGSNNVAVTPDIPTAGCDLDQLADGSNYGNLFQYNENLVTAVNDCELNGWVVRSSGSLTNARGYSAWLQANSTAEWVGSVNTGNINVAVTKSNSGNAAADGWNILGNPYPEPIRRNDVLSANGQLSSLQYFDVASGYTGTYQPYTNGSSIAISQAFAAHTNSTGTVSFNNTMRNPVFGTAWYRTAEDWYSAKLDIIVEGNGFRDKTHLYFNPEATDEFDRMYDCAKRESRPGQPTLFSIGSDDEPLSLNAVADERMTEAEFPIGIITDAEGTFTFTVEGVETFPADHDVYFIDHFLGQTFDLRVSNSFTYELEDTDLRDRFEIGVLEQSSVTSVFENEMDYAHVSATGHDINIFWKDRSGTSRITVVNAVGQVLHSEVAEMTVNDTKTVSLPEAADGIYFVVFEREEGYGSAKVFLNRNR